MDSLWYEHLLKISPRISHANCKQNPVFEILFQKRNQKKNPIKRNFLLVMNCAHLWHCTIDMCLLCTIWFLLSLLRKKCASFSISVDFHFYGLTSFCYGKSPLGRNVVDKKKQQNRMNGKQKTTHIAKFSVSRQFSTLLRDMWWIIGYVLLTIHQQQQS